MVVLTDKASASATEIFAGALQDYNRALIVGSSSTYGKGTVQQPMDIGRYLNVFQDPTRAGTLKATIQTFYRVTGSSTQLKGVEPDVELPALSDTMKFGEAWQDHALPHNRIAQTPGFTPFAASGLFRPSLKANSEARLKKSQDFQYVLEDIVRNKRSIDENRVSLNRAHRTAELQELETRRKTRNAERRERFATQELEDKKSLKFYRLTLDDLELEKLPEVDRKKDAEAYMRTAEDEEPDLNQSPTWPSGLDAAKREGVSILTDLIEQTEIARTAGVLKQP
jgi:carboxyl-terminal processing protease